jgi:hypothetical protein
MNTYPIIDVDWVSMVEPLTPGWDVWEVDAVLDTGDTIHGTIIGDGVNSFDIESFTPDE